MKVLVVCGHPRTESFCAALAQAYADGAAAAGHEVRLRLLANVPVDLEPPSMTPDPSAVAEWAREAQADVLWCDHLSVVTPMYWGMVSATLKAWIDRVFTSGFAYKFHSGKPWPDKLLAGRSAMVIITSDTPWFVFRWVWGAPLIKQFRHQIFGLCGFKPVRFTYFAMMIRSTPEKRQHWLEITRKKGAKPEAPAVSAATASSSSTASTGAQECVVPRE
ncbi:MAG: NAD(P)H-dependent oxidoreductase [Methylobacteriaceae bacterium]|jgi:putative NADPH-quinone reductase|nr:NAD(P)H-dependent oxidoreductase [Methylobacteriaceae bacterium]